VPQLTFFIGKGGVGKTTLSSCYALHRATKRRNGRVLLLSTDPAHSLADIFDLRLGSAPTRIPVKTGQLFAWQIDAEKTFRQFLDSKRDALLDLVESGTLFTRSEIEPLLDTALPGMGELGALLALKELVTSDEWSEVVVDTAPIGHTLRLFSLPEHFKKFLTFLDLAGNRDRWLMQRFGSKRSTPTDELLNELQEASRAMQAIISGETSRVFLVTSPETFSLKQAVRSVDSLEKIASELPLAAIIVNRAVLKVSSCARCKHRAKQFARAQKFLREQFPRMQQLVSEDPGQPIVGAEALARHADTVFGGRRYTAAKALRTIMPTLKNEPWPVPTKHLSFTVGKGGVGKTTVSASLAYVAREHSKMAVTVCSTDPAPSLDDVFEAEVGNEPRSVLGDRGLKAIEVDSVTEFRHWASSMQEKIRGAFTGQQGRIQVDVSFDRQIFMALLDIVPPGVDEIFAIFKILDLTADGHQRIVIDMAPTGHAIELLRMPERIAIWTRLLLKTLASHRTLALAQDVAVEIATIGQKVRKLTAMMQDERQACAIAVMLPELLPDKQTTRLLKQVEDLGIHVAGLMVNRVVLDDTTCARCANTQRWQQKVLNRVRKQHAGFPVYLLPERPAEIAGSAALERFTRRVWRLK
jgi:arsenite-transporting ATPase